MFLILISKLVPLTPEPVKYVNPSAGHVSSGNLIIISDSRIRSILARGLKYRFPAKIDFQKCNNICLVRKCVKLSLFSKTIFKLDLDLSYLDKL